MRKLEFSFCLSCFLLRDIRWMKRIWRKRLRLQAGASQPELLRKRVSITVGVMGCQWITVIWLSRKARGGWLWSGATKAIKSFSKLAKVYVRLPKPFRARSESEHLNAQGYSRKLKTKSTGKRRKQWMQSEGKWRSSSISIWS